MRRVFVTGLGVVSSIGNNKEAVLSALRESRSGIAFIPEMKELGFRCHVGGRVTGLSVTGIDKRTRLTMSNVARFAAVAASEAIDDAKLPREALKSDRVAVVVGTTFGGINEAAKVERDKWNRRVNELIAKVNDLKRTKAPRGGVPIARLKRDAQAAGALGHPNLAAVLGVGDHEGQPWVATELVAGVSLAQVLRSRSPWPIRSTSARSTIRSRSSRRARSIRSTSSAASSQESGTMGTASAFRRSQGASSSTRATWATSS